MPSSSAEIVRMVFGRKVTTRSGPMWALYPSAALQRARYVGEQVLRGLDPGREADEAVGHGVRPPPPAALGARVQPAEARRLVDQRARGQEGLRSRRVGQREGEHGAEARHLLRG